MVMDEFMSDNGDHTKATLPVGARGRVIEIHEAQHACILIKWENLGTHWVRERNQGKIQKLEEEEAAKLTRASEGKEPLGALSNNPVLTPGGNVFVPGVLPAERDSILEARAKA